MENVKKSLLFDAVKTPGAIKIAKRKTNILAETLINYQAINVKKHDSTFFDNNYFKQVWKNAYYL